VTSVDNSGPQTHRDKQTQRRAQYTKHFAQARTATLWGAYMLLQRKQNIKTGIRFGFTQF